jgi:AcrR family transcriptional regulator
MQMASPAKPATAPRTPLNRDRVLRAGMALADENGIGSLSMRKLGEALGVEAMSLYNHVASRGDLFDGMIDLVFGEIGLPSGGAGWKAAMRQRALSARQALSRHPWAIGLMESRSTPGANTGAGAVGHPASQHVFQPVAACRKSGSGPGRAAVWESFVLQHGEHALGSAQIAGCVPQRDRPGP